MPETTRPLPSLLTAVALAITATLASAQPDKPQQIAGVVIAPGGRPVARASVEATPVTSAEAPARTTKTNEDGQFEIGALPHGPYRLKIEAKGFTTSVLKSIATGRTDLEIVLERIPGLIQGTVLDPTGKPVADAWVKTMPNSDPTVYLEGPPPPVTNKTVKTDGQGRFRLGQLAPGTYRVKVLHPEFVYASLRDKLVQSDKTTDLGVISLERGTKVTGEVRVGVQPASQVKVVIHSAVNAAQPKPTLTAEAVTDEKGRFVIPLRLPHGSYQVMASRMTLPNPLLQITDFNKTKTVIVLKPGQEDFSLPIAIEK